MIGTAMRVARAEGLRSAARRARERIEERVRREIALARGAFSDPGHAPLLNVLAASPASRLGGLQIQLAARLREESALRPVAFVHPGVLEMSSKAWRARTITEALAHTRARAIVLEGATNMPALDADVILVLHDLAMLDNLSGRELLQRARAIIFPSAFLRDRHREHFDLPRLDAHVIEPGLPRVALPRGNGARIAYAGSVKRHKGGHLLPEIVAAFPRHRFHVFGGGDSDLLAPLRRLPNVSVHGYYRAGELPSLLARHDIGLTLLPSMVPEAFGLTLSESWSAGVPAVAFDHGAQAERIRRDGGGWLAPLDRGARGIIAIVQRWLSGERTAAVPRAIATSRDAAIAHVALYRSLGLLD